MTEKFDFEPFVTAQRDTYESALREVHQGRKQGHWMWFIFPQIIGLGRSDTARRYALSGLAEAQAYLAHPVLGPRLREITAALNDLQSGDAEGIFGNIDAMKLRSSLTLFAQAESESAGLFSQALDHWFNGERDQATLSQLS